jgi:hypothetical protein
MSRSRSHTRSRSRFADKSNRDLAIQIEVLEDRMAKLEQGLLKIQVDTARVVEWLPWLFKLFRWAHSTFRKVPEWATASEVREWKQDHAMDASTHAVL